MCSKAGLRVAAASQVTNWQDCFPLLLIVGVGVFTAAADSPCRRPGPALEREREGNDGDTIRIFSLTFFFLCLQLCLSFHFPLFFHHSSSCLSICLCLSCLFLFILSLSLQATSHIINLLLSPSPPLLICTVICCVFSFPVRRCI